MADLTVAKQEVKDFIIRDNEARWQQRPGYKINTFVADTRDELLAIVRTAGSNAAAASDEELKKILGTMGRCIQAHGAKFILTP